MYVSFSITINIHERHLNDIVQSADARDATQALHQDLPLLRVSAINRELKLSCLCVIEHNIIT